MVMKSRGLMTRKSRLPENWHNLSAKQPYQVPYSSMIFLSVSILSGIGQVQRSFILVQYIPEWVSWFSYKPLARLGYNIGQEVLRGPMEFVREAIVSICIFKNV
jgi:hypothetical protein